MNPSKPNQPSLSELMTRFLAQPRTESPTNTTLGEVVPHEVLGSFRSTASSTWTDAFLAFRVHGVTPERVETPPEWNELMAAENRVVALPLMAGVIPQWVRDLSRLMNIEQPATTWPQMTGFAQLRGWVRSALRSRSATLLLLASGVAARLGDWDDAFEALRLAEPLCSGAWADVLADQKAALTWLHNPTENLRFTSQSVVAGFNLGLQALTAGDTTLAQSSFRSAIDELPEASGWTHLAALYLSLAESRSA